MEWRKHPSDRRKKQRNKYLTRPCRSLGGRAQLTTEDDDDVAFFDDELHAAGSDNFFWRAALIMWVRRPDVRCMLFRARLLPPAKLNM